MTENDVKPTDSRTIQHPDANSTRLEKDGLGIKCPACGSLESSSISSRRIGNAVSRYRTCQMCMKSFKTYEVIANVANQMKGLKALDYKDVAENSSVPAKQLELIIAPSANGGWSVKVRQ